MTFDYGQRHRVEVEHAHAIPKKLSIPHKVLYVDLRQIGGSSLTDSSLPLAEFASAEEIPEGLPDTYIPFRNGILLSMAAGWAEAHGAHEIVCGFHVLDSPNYPDTRRDFVRAMERAINAGTGASFGGKTFRIIAPFLNMKKSEILREGLALGADYAHAISCYRGTEIPCQRCSSCLLRQKAWEELGMEDPLITRLKKEGKL